MWLDIPFNGDMSLREKVEKAINPAFHYSLYVTLPGLKSARPTADVNQIGSFIKKNADIYKGLINAPAKWEDIRGVIDFYYSIGVKSFVVNDFKLAENIKKTFNSIHLPLGVFSFINEGSSHDYSMFDTVVIPHYFANRNHEQLKKYLLVLGHKASVFLNQICSFGCTEYKEHADFLLKNKKGQRG